LYDHDDKFILKSIIKIHLKELANKDFNQISLVLSCLCNICTPEIASILIDKVLGLLSHTKALIRKKAVNLLSKFFLLDVKLIPGNLEKAIA
jgi:vesicle coat complex subunit